MNNFFPHDIRLLNAAVLLILLLGVAHSVFGELFIFRSLRQNGKWKKIETFRAWHLQLLWGTWHLISLFGWCLAAILWIVAHPENAVLGPAVVHALTATFALATPFWLYVSKGRHPAWIVFLAIAVLSWLGL